MSSFVPLCDLDADPGRRFTTSRPDVDRLVRKLRHRGFGDVAAERTEFELRVRGVHRLTGHRVELTLDPARVGEREERGWYLVVSRDNGSLSTDLWVGTKYRWRQLGELDPVGRIAAVTERVTARSERWARWPRVRR